MISISACQKNPMLIPDDTSRQKCGISCAGYGIDVGNYILFLETLCSFQSAHFIRNGESPIDLEKSMKILVELSLVISVYFRGVQHGIIMMNSKRIRSAGVGNFGVNSRFHPTRVGCELGLIHQLRTLGRNVLW